MQPKCPKCGKKMVIRKTKNNPEIGSFFINGELVVKKEDTKLRDRKQSEKSDWVCLKCK